MFRKKEMKKYNKKDIHKYIESMMEIKPVNSSYSSDSSYSGTSRIDNR